jgi:Cytochrome c554 and c-prime
MHNKRWRRIGSLRRGVVSVLGITLLACCGCPTVSIPPPTDGGGDGGGGGQARSAYVGSARCGDCHPDLYASFLQTGHPYKLNAVEDGKPPEYPITTVTDAPADVEWQDVAFVIGGFRYKYRVVDQDGYIVLGPTAQFNFPSGGFSGYSNDDAHTSPDGTPGPWDANVGRKPYDCGKCHTTGYDADTENRRGMDGLVGDWEFEGVHCEECHGAGADHVEAATPEDRVATITGNPDTTTVCGKCHTRSPDGIAAKGGFVRHHEQWDEFSRSPHAAVMRDGCMTCHDPHEPIFDAQRLEKIQEAFTAGNVRSLAGLDDPPGIIASCEDCHPSVEVSHAGPSECKVCHMAYTTKSAVAIGPNAGDIRSHAFVINSDPDAFAFTDADGNPVARDGDVAFSALDENGMAYITLDFACLQCHDDETVEWAASRAEAIHP